MAKAVTNHQSGEAFTPQMATQKSSGGYPLVEHRHPYVLVYSPRAWHVAGGLLVPRLGQIPLIDGCNQVSRDPSGDWRLSMLNTRLEEEGRTRIPYSWGPNGSYLQAVKSRPNRTVITTYISAWESAHSGDRDTYPDSEAYAKWCASLIGTGPNKLPACPAFKIRELLDRARQSFIADEAAQEKKASPARAARLTAYGKTIAVLEAELKKIGTKARTKKAPATKATPNLDGDPNG